MELDDTLILDSSLDRAFELLKIFRLDIGNPETREEELECKYIDNKINLIKYGILHKFDLMYFLTENFVEDPTNQCVYIPNKRIGSKIAIDDFTNELDDRKTLAKKVLLELNSNESFFRPNQK